MTTDVIPGQFDDRRPLDDDGYRGIPFGEWLELFLDYAICLAIGGNGEEAYLVCEAARDSIVFTNSKDYMFLIHVAWAGQSPSRHISVWQSTDTPRLCNLHGGR